MKSKEKKFIQKIEKKVKKIFNLIEKLQEESFNDELERLMLEHKSKEKHTLDVGKLKDIYRDEFGYIFQVNKNYREYSDMWNAYKNKKVPKITGKQQETAMTALKNNIPEQTEKIRQQKLEAWDFTIWCLKITTIAIMLFLIMLAVYFLIIEK